MTMLHIGSFYFWNSFCPCYGRQLF